GKFGCDGLRMNPLGHEVVTPVAQRTDDLRSQRFIEELDHDVDVASVTFGHWALIDMLPGALSQGLDVGQKGLVGARQQGAFRLSRRTQWGGHGLQPRRASSTPAPAPTSSATPI